MTTPYVHRLLLPCHSAGAEYATAFELSVLEGSSPVGGFAIYGRDSNDVAGRFVGGAGDVNGDGLALGDRRDADSVFVEIFRLPE